MTKKLILSLTCFICVLNIHAQTVNNDQTITKKVELVVGKFLFTQTVANKSKYTYCTVCEGRAVKLFDSRSTLVIDFGQPNRELFTNNYLKDADGKDLLFNSVMDGINYLTTFGWELQQVYVVPHGSDGDTSSTTYYLLRKETD